MHFRFFSKDSEVTLGTFAVDFWTSFRHEIRWCFGMAKGCGEELKAAAWSSVVAVAAGAEVSDFYKDSEVTLITLAVHFWMLIRREMTVFWAAAVWSSAVQKVMSLSCEG